MSELQRRGERVGESAMIDAWVPRGNGVDRWTRRLTTWYWRHVYRLQAHGVEHVPLDGPVLLVPNHSSYADPFLHACEVARPVRYMTKSTLLDMPIVGRIVRAGGGFPVRRGSGDVFAMDLAARLLRDGQLVFVYPEGTRFRDQLELGPPRRGAARLALDAGVPVVPVGAWGAKRRELYGRAAWRRPRVTVVYGEPLSWPGGEADPPSVDEVRDQIWDAVQALYEAARRLDEQRRTRRAWRRSARGSA